MPGSPGNDEADDSAFSKQFLGTLRRNNRYNNEKKIVCCCCTKAKWCSILMGVITVIAVAVTFVCAFLFPRGSIKGINIFYAAVMTLVGISHLGQICCRGETKSGWIYYNAVTIILMGVVGNLYIHDVKF